VTATRRVLLQQLVGRRVRDGEGRVVGRIESIRGSLADDGRLEVREYWMGTAAALARLGISAARLVGLPIAREPLRVPWDALDLADPERPRLLVEVTALRRRSAGTSG
jgi:hypothetical protein